MSSPTSIQVSETSAQAAERAERQKLGKPTHWVHAQPTEFQNPWPSFWRYGVKDFFQMLGNLPSSSAAPSASTVAQIPIQKPSWGLEGANDAGVMSGNADKVKATWLGHACFLVGLPATAAGPRGARILFDPVFSDRCSPSQWFGPKRFTPAPCSLQEIPDFDAIVISHNHYDHMDTTTLNTLLARSPPPHVFAPLGNEAYFHSLGLPTARAHCLDWWDARRVSSVLSPIHTVHFDITLTPGQHFTGRGLLDRYKSLWGSWVVETVAPEATAAILSPARVWFGGDTGYRSVPSNEDGPDTLPVCPAFKEIGTRFSGFDLALIPIGAYNPRRFMSPVHCAPRDSVAIFQDIRARRALGMHWGTWYLTTEDPLEPPVLLATECSKAGVKDGAFGVCAIGETVAVDVGEGSA